MTAAGWVVMGLCWAFVAGVSAYLVCKTLRAPRHQEEPSDSRETQG